MTMRTYHATMARGFTLIELLMVITVTAVLSSLLFMLVSSVRSKANTTRSLANLRGVGQAIMLYATEHGNNLPNRADPRNGAMVSRDLMDSYLDYEDPAWKCPIMEIEQSGLPERYQGRYIYNWRLTNFNDGWRDNVSAINLSTVSQPSEALLAANLSSGMRGGYRDGYANALFVDGSARRIPDSTYLGGDIGTSTGVCALYVYIHGGKIRGYDEM